MQIFVLVLAATIAATPAAAFLDFVELQETNPAFRLTGVTPSPDGRHVYAAAYFGDAILTFERDAQTSDISLVDALYDTSPGVDGLFGAYAVAVSGDGRHVYVAAFFEDAVSGFSRDPATGRLTWIGVWKDGVGGVEGLDGALGVYVNPDGSQVYVASMDDNAVAVFARDALTGLLTETQVLEDGPGEFNYLQPSEITSTPNGYFVYVAGSGVVALQRDLFTGTLTEIDQENQVEGASLASQALAVSPDVRHLYVTDWYNDRTVCFTIDAATGALTYASQVFGGAPAGYPSQSHGIAMSPEGARVYVGRLAAGNVLVYLRDPESGALTLEETRQNGSDGVAGITALFGVVATRDGGSIYLPSYDNASVVAFATPDRVAFLQRIWDGDSGVQGLNGADAVAVSPDGAHVYTASLEGGVASFRRGAGGDLAFLDAVGDASLDGAASIAISPNGVRVLVAARTGDSLSVFERNPTTGALALVDQALDDSNGVDGLDGAIGVVLSSDGQHAYVASAGDHAVASFEVGGGGVGFLEQDAVPGVGRDAQPTAIAIAPDDALVYVAASGGSVAIFERAFDGTLTLHDTVQTDGMAGATAIAVSPDGAHVYVGAEDDDAIVVLERQGAALVFVEAERAGVSGLTPLSGGAKSLAISPDGTELYAADAQDGSIARFARDPATGALRFVELERDFTNLQGFDGFAALATSPDGENLYAATATSDSVLSFSTVPEPLAGGAVAAAALLALRRRLSARRA